MPARRPRDVAQWLSAAARGGLVRVDARTIVAVERLLRTQSRWDADELASRLASLLAHDAASWHRLRRHFLDALARRDPPPEVVVRRMLRRAPARLWAAVIVVLVATVATLGPRALTATRRAVAHTLAALLAGEAPSPSRDPVSLTALRRWSAQHFAELRDLLRAHGERAARTYRPPRPTVRVEVTDPERFVALAPRVALIDPPDGGHLSSVWLALWIACSAALAGLAARWWWFGLADTRRLADQAADASLARQDELMRGVDRVRAIYYVPPALPFARDDIDEAATLLARISSGEPGRELDVAPTVQQTIAAGGRTSPVFAPAASGQTLLILVDVETREGHAFLAGVEQLLAAWERGGLRFARYDFHGSPDRLTADRRDTTLEQLLQRHEGAPLLLFSRLLDAREFDLELSWMTRLRTWPRRAWIDLDPSGASPPHRRHALAEAEHTGLVRFPCTRAGLLACARALARGELRGAVADDEALPAAVDLREALELWAACAACVPDPTWSQLDAVRRELPALADALPDPRLLGRLLEWLHRCGWLEPDAERGQGERLLLTERAVEELLVRLRERDAGRPEAEQLEPATRRLLIDQLLAADLDGDPYGEVRRELKLRHHRALLHPFEVEALLDMADAAVADELQRMLQVERRVHSRASARRWSRATLARVEALGGEAPRTLVSGLISPTWARTHALVFMSGSAAVLGAWALAWRLGALEPPPTREITPQTLRVPAISRVNLEPPLRPELVTIRGGEFTMGSPADEQALARLEILEHPGIDRVRDWYRDETQHPARVGDFALCATEVTQGQWKAVMGLQALAPRQCGGDECDDDKPIANMSWFEAIDYLERLTALENQTRAPRERLSSCYSRARGVTWDRRCTGYRLPTETEWEYAARAGSTTAFSFGDDSQDICEHANILDQSGRLRFVDRPAADCDDGEMNMARVGSYRPNAYGLYDMYGNVFEWVWDRYALYGFAGADEHAADGETVLRGLRGGNLMSTPMNARSAYRDAAPPREGPQYRGIRCARSL